MTVSFERKSEILAELTDISRKQNEYQGLLDRVLQQASQIKDSLDSLSKQERELAAELAGAELRPAQAPKRKYLDKDAKAKLRHQIHTVMRELTVKGLTNVPMEIIVKAVQEYSDQDESTIQRQVKALSDSERSPVTHNGLRGQGSTYHLAESKG